MPALITAHTGDGVVKQSKHSCITTSIFKGYDLSCQCREDMPIVQELANMSLGLSSGSYCTKMDGSADVEHGQTLKVPKPRIVSRCSSALPLLKIVDSAELPQRSASLPLASPEKANVHPLLRLKAKAPIKASFVYNEYGELADERVLMQCQTTDELSAVQILRIIKKHYHHELRSRLGKILVLRTDGTSTALVDDGIWKERLTSWDMTPGSSKGSMTTTPDDNHSNGGCPGPRRVLELGCSDGQWCFNFKRVLPHWVVDGIDDTNHWLCGGKGVLVKDATAARAKDQPADYFNACHEVQDTPDFTLRNLNCLLAHKNPIPHNVYEFIRAREIFDRIESYKTFLDDIRQILKPNGVVEFFEIDPRPRTLCPGGKSDRENKSHESAAETNWTDNIRDRFKDSVDEELATTTPAWTARVAERMKANTRPQDGVPAVNLVSWLEGAGFWDVKELIMTIHVGGDTQAGQLLKDFVKYQTVLEDELPKLRAELPQIDMNDLESGAYYLNLHIVTARKPHPPRPGDLLPNGERQEMTASTYDAMARSHETKSSQWKRLNLDTKLTSMMQNLTMLPNTPDTRRTITVAQTGSDAGRLPIMGRSPDIETPFHAPPFVQLVVADCKAPSTTIEREVICP